MRSFILFLAYIMLPCLAQTQPELVLPLMHSEVANGEFSNNNKYLLSYSDKVILWDAASARVLRTFESAGSHVTLASFINANNNILAVYGNAIKAWERESGKLLFELKGHKDEIYKAVLNKDGKVLATLSRDNTIIVWDIINRRARYTFPAVRDKIDLQLSINEEGDILVAAGTMKTGKGNIDQFIAWNIQTGRQIKTQELPGYPSYLAFNKNELIISVDNKLMLFDIKSWKQRDTDLGIGGSSFAVLSPGNSLLASDSRSFQNNSEYISIIDTKTLQEKYSLSHSEGVVAYIFTSDSTLVSSTLGGTIYYWNVITGENISMVETGNKGKQQVFLTSKDLSRTALISSLARQFDLLIWNTRSKFLLSAYNNKINMITDVIASANGDSILFNNEQTLKLWNTKKIENIPVTDLLDDHKKELKDVLMKGPSFLPKNDELEEIYVDWKRKRVLTLHKLLRDSIKVIDIKTGVRLGVSYEKNIDTSLLGGYSITQLGKGNRTYPFSKYLGYDYMRMSNDGERLFTAYRDGNFAIWNVEEHKMILQDSIKDVKIYGVKFHPGGSLLYIQGDDDSLYEYDINKKSVTKKFAVSFDDDNWILNTYCTALLKSGGEFVNLADGSKLYNIPGAGEGEKMLFNSTDKLLAYGTKDHNINIWDAEKRKLIFSLAGHSGTVMSLAFCRNNTRLVSSSSDNTIKVWDLVAGKLIVTLILFGESDFVTILPSGYYMGTKAAVNNLSFRSNGKLYPVQQFDLQFNRPDKVLEALGGSETSLIESYKKAWQKRLHRLGIKEPVAGSEFHLPTAEIVNGNNVPAVTNIPQLHFAVKAGDTKYPLSKLFITINDIPAYGSKGIPVSQASPTVLNKNIGLQLNAGINKIEVSCLNQMGAESLKDILYVNYEPLKGPVAAKTYFVGIGVSRYRDSTMDLHFAVKDIHDLDSAFRSVYEGNYESVLLTDENVTAVNIGMIKQKLMKTGIEDRVIISLSGHGLLGKSKEFYFATHDIDFKDPSSQGFSYSSLEDLLDGIPARKKLLFMDACHSGELDNDIVITGNNNSKEPGTKGAAENFAPDGLGLQNSFELMKELFAELNSGNGTIVISAAGGLEYAYENTELNNGVFTYCIKTALLEGAADINNDNLTSVMELKKYVSKMVEEKTNGRQRPTSRKETLQTDWKVW